MRSALRLSTVAALACSAFAPLRAQEPAAPPTRTPLEGIYSFAEVVGPRGTFTTEIVSLADGRARFVQVHPEPRGRAELLTAAGGSGSTPGAAFQRDEAGAFVAAPPEIGAFVHGHDVPRLANAQGGRPAQLEIPPSAGTGGSPLTIELGDWRNVAGIDLPYTATFVHRGERFAYRYKTLLPFRLAPGSSLPDSPDLLFARLLDLGELAAAHERVMAAHRASDAAALTEGTLELSTISGRGKLTYSTRAEFETRMRGYLGAIRFSRYEDLVAPVVAVSLDGTMGWLGCEMAAEGIHTLEGGKSEAFEYGFSWVELYSRGLEAAAVWRSTGNASSRKP